LLDVAFPLESPPLLVFNPNFSILAIFEMRDAMQISGFR